MDQALKFEEIAWRLLGSSGIHAIRWTDKEAGHVVTIDWSGATAEEKRAIQAEANKIVDANPTHMFSITMAGK